MGVGVGVAVGVGVTVGRGVAVGVGVGVSVGMAAMVAATSARTVAGMSGVGVGVGVGIARRTAAVTVAGMSGVAVGGAPEPQAATASPTNRAAVKDDTTVPILCGIIVHGQIRDGMILTLKQAYCFTSAFADQAGPPSALTHGATPHRWDPGSHPVPPLPSSPRNRRSP